MSAKKRDLIAEATKALHEINEWCDEIYEDQGLTPDQTFIDVTRNWIYEYARNDEPLAREVCRRQGIDFRRE